MSDPVLVALIAAAASIVTVLLQVRIQFRQGRIAAKVAETHHQLSVNSHSSATPTVLDKLDDLTVAVSEVTSRLDRHEIAHAEGYFRPRPRRPR
jgi:hypothetical protein